MHLPLVQADQLRFTPASALHDQTCCPETQLPATAFPCALPQGGSKHVNFSRQLLNRKMSSPSYCSSGSSSWSYSSIPCASGASLGKEPVRPAATCPVAAPYQGSSTCSICCRRSPLHQCDISRVTSASSSTALAVSPCTCTCSSWGSSSSGSRRHATQQWPPARRPVTVEGSAAAAPPPPPAAGDGDGDGSRRSSSRSQAWVKSTPPCCRPPVAAGVSWHPAASAFPATSNRSISSIRGRRPSRHVVHAQDISGSSDGLTSEPGVPTKPPLGADGFATPPPAAVAGGGGIGGGGSEAQTAAAAGESAPATEPAPATAPPQGSQASSAQSDQSAAAKHPQVRAQRGKGSSTDSSRNSSSRTRRGAAKRGASMRSRNRGSGGGGGGSRDDSSSGSSGGGDVPSGPSCPLSPTAAAKAAAAVSAAAADAATPPVDALIATDTISSFIEVALTNNRLQQLCSSYSSAPDAASQESPGTGSGAESGERGVSGSACLRRVESLGKVVVHIGKLAYKSAMLPGEQEQMQQLLVRWVLPALLPVVEEVEGSVLVRVVYAMGWLGMESGGRGVGEGSEEEVEADAWAQGEQQREGVEGRETQVAQEDKKEQGLGQEQLEGEEGKGQAGSEAVELGPAEKDAAAAADPIAAATVPASGLTAAAPAAEAPSIPASIPGSSIAASAAQASEAAAGVSRWCDRVLALTSPPSALTTGAHLALLQGLALCGHCPPVEWLHESAAAAAGQLPGLEPEDKAVVLQAWGQLGYRPPAWVIVPWVEALEPFAVSRGGGLGWSGSRSKGPERSPGEGGGGDEGGGDGDGGFNSGGPAGGGGGDPGVTPGAWGVATGPAAGVMGSGPAARGGEKPAAAAATVGKQAAATIAGGAGVYGSSGLWCKHQGWLSPGNMVGVLCALQEIGYVPPKTWLGQYMQHSKRKLPSLSITQLAELAGALCWASGLPSKKWCGEWASRVQVLMPVATAEELVMVLHAAVGLKVELRPGWVHECLTHVKLRRRELSLRQLADVAHAVANLPLRPSLLKHHMGWLRWQLKLLRREWEELSRQEVLYLLYAAGKLRMRGEMKRVWVKGGLQQLALGVEGAAPAELAASLVVFANFAGQVERGWLEGVLVAVGRQVGVFSNEGLLQVVMACEGLGCGVGEGGGAVERLAGFLVGRFRGGMGMVELTRCCRVLEGGVRRKGVSGWYEGVLKEAKSALGAYGTGGP